MYQAKKNILLTVSAFIFGSILAVLLGTPSADRLTDSLVTFGNFLRILSLKSVSGNMGAWAIVITLSCLPLLGLLWKNRSKADLLLILSGAEIFAMLYYLVNPTRVSKALNWMDAGTIAKAWALISAGCIAGSIVCWVLLRLLKILCQKPAVILPGFLFWTAIIYAFLLGFSGIRGMETSVAELVRGNSQEQLIGSSRNMIFVLHTLKLIPEILGVWVILLAGKLTLALEKDPFGEETVTLAEGISGKTVFVAKTSLLLTVFANVLQMVCFSKILKVHMEIQIPLLTLVLCAALMLLCKYFRRAKEVNDDNASII